MAAILNGMALVKGPARTARGSLIFSDLRQGRRSGSSAIMEIPVIDHLSRHDFDPAWARTGRRTNPVEQLAFPIACHFRGLIVDAAGPDGQRGGRRAVGRSS